MRLTRAFLPILLSLLLVMSGIATSSNENEINEQNEDYDIIQTVIVVIIFLIVIIIIAEIITEIFSPNGEG